MPSQSKVLIASAGSGKTTWIINNVLRRPGERTAITTFTINNTERIAQVFEKRNSVVPSYVTLQSWFSFLLYNLVRPYQNFVIDQRIASINLVSGRSAPRIPSTNNSHFVDKEGRVYTDKISKLSLLCDDRSQGLVMTRLRRAFDRIYIDEVQDLAGYDLDLVERMMKAGIPVTMVGDPRQGTFSTNNSAKNRQYRGSSMIEKFGQWEKKQLCSLFEKSESYRCNQSICNIADSLYPAYSAALSRNSESTEHDGVFVIASQDLERYCNLYSPQVLRYDNRTRCTESRVLNFGAAKGLEFQRVLIIPNGPIAKWLKSGSLTHIEKSLAKLYVAITRARSSVAFVFDGECGVSGIVRFRLP